MSARSVLTATARPSRMSRAMNTSACAATKYAPSSYLLPRRRGSSSVLPFPVAVPPGSHVPAGSGDPWVPFFVPMSPCVCFRHRADRIPTQHSPARRDCFTANDARSRASRQWCARSLRAEHRLDHVLRDRGGQGPPYTSPAFGLLSCTSTATRPWGRSRREGQEPAARSVRCRAGLCRLPADWTPAIWARSRAVLHHRDHHSLS